MPAKLALTVYAPRAFGVNDTDTLPEASVVPVSVVCPDDGSVKVNMTDAPETAPVGALVRESVVLTLNGLPTRAVAGAVSGASAVDAELTVTGAEAVSAITGKAPVWSAKKPAAFWNEAVAVKLPAFGKLAVTVATPSALVTADSGVMIPPNEKLTVWPAIGAPPGCPVSVALKLTSAPATALAGEIARLVR